MRALVFSDIHNNLEHVQLMREQERNEYDALICAGDVGEHILDDFIKVMDTFGCPVYLVYGNWDRKAAYRLPASDNCVLLNHNIEHCGELFITGFSGCTAGWGRNPHYLSMDEHETVRGRSSAARVRQALELNRAELIDTVRRAGVPQDRLVVVTHERLARFAESGFRPLLHIFGHVHQYRFGTFKGTYYLNAAALDSGTSALRGRRTPEPEGYCVLEIHGSEVRVERRLLL